jgi:hypothetical protein
MPDFGNARRRFLKTAAGFSVLAASGIAKAQFVPPPASPGQLDTSNDAPVSIDVDAHSIPWFDRHDHDRVRFGALEYRSGLVLTSPSPRFGGLSGLRLDAKGERFISFSDKGQWFTGRIVYEGRAMTRLADVETAPMLGADGKPITAHGWYDSESIALDGSLVYIGLERANKVLRFDFSKGFTRAWGEVVPLPLAASRLPNNKGLEALVFVPKGQPLAGHIDRDFRTWPRRKWQPHCVPGRRRDTGSVRRPPYRRLRCQRRRAAACRRSLDPGAKIFLDVRSGHPHPAHPAPFGRARRRDRWSLDFRGRPRQRGR